MGARIVSVHVRCSDSTVAPAGWTSGRGAGSFDFTSRLPGELPPDIPVRIEVLPSPVIPVLVVMLVPVSLGYWIRSRVLNAPTESKVNWFSWWRWISLGTWLYWFGVSSVLHVGDSLVRVGFPVYAAWVVGALLYSVPPLISEAACLTVMYSLLSASGMTYLPLLRREMVGVAKVIVPLGMFLVGMRMSFLDWKLGVMGLLPAYVVYFVLS